VCVDPALEKKKEKRMREEKLAFASTASVRKSSIKAIAFWLFLRANQGVGFRMARKGLGLRFRVRVSVG
jgi:hypothetical protein